MLFDLLWPLISPTVIVYLLSVCLPAGVEAWAGPNNEGQPQPELAWAARAVAVGDPLLCLLVIVYGSPGTVLVAYSVYYVAIQFLSEHRLTWVNLSAGWFCVPGHAPAVDPWEALTLYPLAAFATVGLRRTC